jgi:hypothetical protein
VRQDGYSLLSANEKLKKDKELVLEAVRGDGLVFMTVSEDLHNDKEVALAAVKNNGMALEFASRYVRKQRPIVIEAVKQNGHALRFANEIYRADRTVVQHAVAQKLGDRFEGTDHLNTPEEWLHWARGWVKDLCQAEWPPKSKTREEVLAEVEAQRIARVGMKPRLQNKHGALSAQPMTNSRRRSIIRIADEIPALDPSATTLPAARKLRLGSMFGEASIANLGSRGVRVPLAPATSTNSATDAGLLRIQHAMLGVAKPRCTSTLSTAFATSPTGGGKLKALVGQTNENAPPLNPWAKAVVGGTGEHEDSITGKHKGRFSLLAATASSKHRDSTNSKHKGYRFSLSGFAKSVSHSKCK